MSNKNQLKVKAYSYLELKHHVIWE